MGFIARARNKSQIRKGRAKQRLGRLTNNRRMRAEGLADRLSGGAKQFGEHAKDVGKDIGKDVKRALHR